MECAQLSEVNLSGIYAEWHDLGKFCGDFGRFLQEMLRSSLFFQNSLFFSTKISII